MPKRGLDIDEKIPHKRGTNYLLAIAVNAYQHAPKLSNCVKDAEAIIEVLVSKYDFQKHDVTILFDKAATRANIDMSLRQLAKKIKKEDNLLIYFAGHGVYDKEGGTGGYLVPVEAEPGNFWQFFSNVNFLNLIKAIKSFHTFLLMDSCFSGSLFRSAGDGSTKLAENVERFPSRWGLAAGMIEEVEDGWHDDNSPFAQAVLQYLKTNTNAKFPASELVQYTKRVTPRNAKQTPIGGPLYKVGDLDGEFVFHLKKDETADWKTAVDKNTVKAYEWYLAAYPSGKYVEKANKNIRQLKAGALWQQIKEATEEDGWQVSQKVRLIEKYVEQFDGEKHYDEALDLGEYLETKKTFLSAKNSRFALLKFVQRDTPFKKEAEKILLNWKRKEEEEKVEEKEEEEEMEGLEEEEGMEGKEQKRLEAEKRQKAVREKAVQGEKIKAKKREKKQAAASGSRGEEPSFFQKYGKWIGAVLLLVIAIFVIGKIVKRPGVEKVVLTLYQDKEGEYGYEKNGDPFIDPQYTHAGDFKKGRAEVTRLNESFFINEKGDCVKGCPPLYRYAEAGGYGVKNDKNIKLTDAIYDDVGFFGEGFIAVLKNDKWGYVNENGEEVLPLIYDEVDAQGFKQERSWVRIGEEKFFINKKGERIEEESRDPKKEEEPTTEEVTDLPPPVLSSNFNGDKIIISIKNGKPPYTIFLNKNGKTKVQKEYQKAGRYTIDITSYRKEAGAYKLVLKDAAGRTDSKNLTIDAAKAAEPNSSSLSAILSTLEKNMVKISGGTFTMGQSDPNIGCEGCTENEQPTHKVTLNSFKINKYEVTQEEWRAVMGGDPPKLRFKGCDKCPVERVSWNDIQEFLKRLNKKTGKKYRLPTEAEWEYAARGGQNYKYAGSNNIESVAWYGDNSDSKTHAVGGKRKNGYGLYDMSGNVWEWCSDWYGDYSSGAQTNPKGAGKGSSRVYRGGSWSDFTRFSRVSDRSFWEPGLRNDFIGFRLTRSL